MNIFIMKWLIELYVTVAFGIVCKRIIMKSVIKSVFEKVKYERFLERKLNEKWY